MVDVRGFIRFSTKNYKYFLFKVLIMAKKSVKKGTKKGSVKKPKVEKKAAKKVSNRAAEKVNSKVAPQVEQPERAQRHEERRRPVRGKNRHHGYIILLFVLVIIAIMITPMFIDDDIYIESAGEEVVIEPEDMVEIIIDQEPEPEPEVVPIEPAEEKIIVERFSFAPDIITIEEGTTIRWISEDSRRHKVVCYINSRRIFVGDELYTAGEEVEFRFKDSGEYLCLDSVFGSRMNIIVKPISLSRLTGSSIRDLPTQKVIITGLLMFVVMLTLSIYMYSNEII
jgi:plastocyanin